MRHTPRFVVAVAALILAAGAVAPAAALSASATASGAASAVDGPDRLHAPARPVVLALGDSVAAGQQSAPIGTTFARTAQQWRQNGYVARFHEALTTRLDCAPPRSPLEGCPHLQLVDISRTGIPGGPGGVTTTTMLEPGDQLDRAVDFLERRNGDRLTRNDVEVVTLTVGGNDLFGPAVASCVPPTAACGPTLATVFQGFAARYDQILSELRAAAGPDTVIMTMTYYNPLPFCALGAGDPAGATVLGNTVLEGGTLGGATLPAGFNDLIRAVSAEHDAVVVDTFGLLGAGDFVGGNDCTHPNAAGHQVIADAFAAAFPG
ncbi:GDSL-type esterase/lipase family protein [Cellulomonas fimi]|uniref:SGNH hydrolase-type esterase domain-containing protein n=1 Tax=Cellulomonas fimi TaxID=1708 RepID=A0A7Y0QGY9_CELFI|nr:GDSL-type esterase/lipase family protein [Cellulomonas fimi]NMR19725.1 hypothetical protein [Cellulomonas fimi]